MDPLADEYVYNSPYAFSENKVTAHVELEGLEAERAGMLQDRLARDYLTGKISEREYRDSNIALGNGGVAGALAVSPVDETTVLIGALAKGYRYLKGLAQSAKIIDRATDAVKAIDKADFVSTPDGTTVSTELIKAQKGFDNAGFEKVEANAENVIYEVPKADGSGTFYSRLQQGKKPRSTEVDGDRIVNTRNTGNTSNKQYVNPNGSDIKGPVPADKRKEIGHIHLEPKKGN